MVFVEFILKQAVYHLRICRMFGAFRCYIKAISIITIIIFHDRKFAVFILVNWITSIEANLNEITLWSARVRVYPYQENLIESCESSLV